MGDTQNLRSQELRDLIKATQDATRADDRAADELRRQNDLEQQRQAREREIVTILRDTYSCVSQYRTGYHAPSIAILQALYDDMLQVLELCRVIASRVLSEKEFALLIDSLTKLTQKPAEVQVDVGSSRVEFDRVDGDVSGNSFADTIAHRVKRRSP